MKSRFTCFAIVLGCLVLAGLLSKPLADPVWDELRRSEPALHLNDLEETVGQGLTIGVLGGFRAIMADFLWLQTNLSWEEQDLPATQSLIKLVTTIDPRPLYFWLNGARIIAYDIPHWRIAAADDRRVVPQSVQRRFDTEQAQVALETLDRALKFHPNDPLLFVEIANIHLRRLLDVETAARYYRLAAEQPGAPFYAGRIYAQLLKQLGRYREAYAWLCEWYPTLPANNPMAMKDLVLARIRDLERRLEIPDGQRFQGTRRDLQ